MSVTFNPETHTYTNNAGQVIPSVTQIISQVLGNDYQGVNQELLNKAAKRGTLLHEQASLLLKGQEYEPYEEITTLQRYVKQHQLPLEGTGKAISECIFNSETPGYPFAGTIDYYDNLHHILYDFKFTSTKHLEAWTWQLSLYAYLINATSELFNRHRVEQAYILQINGSTLKEIPIVLKTEQEVEEFVHKYYNHEVIVKEVVDELVCLSDEVLEKFYQYKKAKAEAEQFEQDFKTKLLDEMQARKVKTFDNGQLRITITEAGTRETIDTTKLKQEHPDLVAEYAKVSEVKPTVRIMVKEN